MLDSIRRYFPPAYGCEECVRIQKWITGTQAVYEQLHKQAKARVYKSYEEFELTGELPSMPLGFADLVQRVTSARGAYLAAAESIFTHEHVYGQ